MNLEIQKVVCLSTGHVLQRDMELLSDERSEQPVFAAEHEYGAFIYIPNEPESVEDLCACADKYGYSDAFCAVLRFGSLHGCRYVHLDSDGPHEPDAGLTINEW